MLVLFKHLNRFRVSRLPGQLTFTSYKELLAAILFRSEEPSSKQLLKWHEL